MSKTQQKALAFTLLILLIGVVHFFFGRTILSAVFYIVEIGLFWIIGAAIAIGFLAALLAMIFNTDTLDKAEKWLEKKIKECDSDCEDCDCCECDDDDDDEFECHVEICRKKKECTCESENTECECEEDDEKDACYYPYCDECIRECELNEDPDAVEEKITDTVEEESSESEDKTEK